MVVKNNTVKKSLRVLTPENNQRRMKKFAVGAMALAALGTGLFHEFDKQAVYEPAKTKLTVAEDISVAKPKLSEQVGFALEKYGLNTKKQVQFVDSETNSIYNYAKKRLAHLFGKRHYSWQDAKNIFKILDDTALTKRRNVIANRDVYDLVDAFKNKEFDCDNLSMLYLMLANKLNIPLEYERVASHAFMRLKTDDGYMYYDPVARKIVGKNYFTELLPNKQMSLEWVLWDYNLSLIQKHDTSNKESINTYRKLLRVFEQNYPTDLIPNGRFYMLKSHESEYAGNYEDALLLMSKAYLFEPRNPIINYHYARLLIKTNSSAINEIYNLFSDYLKYEDIFRQYYETGTNSKVSLTDNNERVKFTIREMSAMDFSMTLWKLKQFKNETFRNYLVALLYSTKHDQKSQNYAKTYFRLAQRTANTKDRQLFTDNF